MLQEEKAFQFCRRNVNEIGSNAGKLNDSLQFVVAISSSPLASSLGLTKTFLTVISRSLQSIWSFTKWNNKSCCLETTLDTMGNGFCIHTYAISHFAHSTKLTSIVIYLWGENETFTPKKICNKVSLYFQMVLSISNL